VHVPIGKTTNQEMSFRLFLKINNTPYLHYFPVIMHKKTQKQMALKIAKKFRR